jgi:excisionase family DNA binding protein
VKAQEAYKMMFKDYPDVVTVEQMCEMLGGISIKTGYRLLKNGSIKSVVVGRRYRIPKLYVFEYLELVEKVPANI